MKVLYVGSTYINNINQQKIKAFSKYEDIEIFLVTPKKMKYKLFDLYAEPLDFKSKNIHFIPLSTLIDARYESYYFYFPQIDILIKKIKPDIIHVEQGAWASSYFQALLAKKLFSPHSKTIFFTWVNLKYRLYFRWWIEKFNLRNTDYAIAGNNDAKNILRERGFKKPIAVIPQLGIDINTFYPMDVSDLKKDLGFNNSDIIVGNIGRMDYAKGILNLIEALNELKELNWKLLLVGDGDIKNEILRKVSKYGMDDRVVLLGPKPHKEIPKYMSCIDIFVLPSLTTKKWAEQFGHVLLEAMATGSAVIGSSSGEIPNVIGDAGLIFQETSINDLKNKLKLLLLDNKLIDKYKKKGLKRVQENFTHDIIVKKIVNVYRELMSEND